MRQIIDMLDLLSRQSVGRLIQGDSNAIGQEPVEEMLIVHVMVVDGESVVILDAVHQEGQTVTVVFICIVKDVIRLETHPNLLMSQDIHIDIVAGINS